MHFAGDSQADIARALERDPSTISRELRRNGPAADYTASDAQQQAARRRRERPLVRKLERPELSNFVRQGLAQYWSPDQIAGRCPKEFPRQPRLRVSRPTIYQWIRRQGEERSYWEQFLRRRGRPPKSTARSPIPARVDIAGRPEIVNRRGRFGDWEGDTVVGRQHRGGLVTLVERKSGFLKAAKVPDRHARRVRRKIETLLGDLPARLRHTCTFDNGKEFSEHERLAERLGCKVYFAKPYCSWQRGSNENTNGLLRQFFAKKTDFAEISHWEVSQTVDLINNRPRRRLGYRTPQEVLAKTCPGAFEN
jgi:IS30 family transposase